MQSITSSGLIRTCALTSIAAAMSVATTANAALTLDLRSTDSANPKLVYPPVGTTNFVLHFDLYAVVTGNDANLTNEGVQDTFFSILSTNTVPPGLKGNLALTLAEPFNGPVVVGGTTYATGYPGLVQDLDGDGDLDIGSNNPNSPDGWVFARSTTMQMGKSEYLLAHVTFTPTAPFLAGETDAAVGLRVTANPTVIPAVWIEDGVQKDPSGGGSYVAGAPVILAVPEPAMALVAGSSLLLRRRNRR